MDRTVKGDIERYSAHAASLKALRHTLKEKIHREVRRKIIPALQPLLPEGYTINPDKSSVDYSSRTEVPEDFRLSLRLEHNNEPIIAGSPSDKRLETIQHTLQDKLKEFSEEYGLSGIQVWGEPEYIE